MGTQFVRIPPPDPCALPPRAPKSNQKQLVLCVKSIFMSPEWTNGRGTPPVRWLQQHFFRKTSQTLATATLLMFFTWFHTFYITSFFFVEKLQPFYIEMAPSRSPQALQHFWYVFYFVTLSPFFVEKLQAFYIGIAPSSSPQALQHFWYCFYFVMCLHPVSFFVLKNSRPSA